MPTILIATDFSPAAHNAALYGIAYAKKLGAKIILFSAYSLPTPFGAINVSVSSYGVLKEMEDKLAQEAAKLLQGDTLPLEIVCEEGDATNTIIAIAKEKQAGLIIIGMQGSAQNLKKVFGSTTTALAQQSSLPVIIVPEEAVFNNIQTIAFASDTVGIDAHQLDVLTSFSQPFDASVHIVTIVKDATAAELATAKIAADKTTANATKKLSHQCITDTDVSHALLTFIAEHTVDILAMVPHKHAWLEKLFTKSETNKMIFTSRIPLLILPEQAEV